VNQVNEQLAADMAEAAAAGTPLWELSSELYEYVDPDLYLEALEAYGHANASALVYVVCLVCQAKIGAGAEIERHLAIHDAIEALSVGMAYDNLEEEVRMYVSEAKYEDLRRDMQAAD
jgi:hypothetical protein